MLPKLWPNITAVEISLNLLLSIIVDNFFENDKCIAFYTTGNSSSDILVTASEVQTTPIIINDFDCDHGCGQFIIEDPDEISFVPYQKCMTEKRNVYIKAIVVIPESDFDPNTNTVSGYVDKFGRDVILIARWKEHFFVLEYGTFGLGFKVTIDRWNIESNHFANENITNDTFSDCRWKRFKNVTIEILFNDDYQLGFKGKDNVLRAIDLILMNAFAKQLNFTLITRQVIVHWELYTTRPYFYIAKRHGQRSMPDSYPATTILYMYHILNARVHKHWFQLVNVFKFPLWILLLISVVTITIYFSLEKWLFRRHINSPIFSVCGLFLLQPMNVHEVPRRFWSRIVFAFALILVVLVSSLFSSGVVSRMITPRFENEIRSEEDIKRRGMVIHTVLIDEDVQASELQKIAQNFHSITEQIEHSISLRSHKEPVAILLEHTEIGLFPRGALIALDVGVDDETNYPKPLKDAVKTRYTYIEAKGTSLAGLLPHLNYFILRCKESGLYSKWEWDLYMTQYTIFEILQNLDNKRAPTPLIALNWEHVKEPFWFLFIGCILASCVFIIEIIYTKIECSTIATT